MYSTIWRRVAITIIYFAPKLFFIFVWHPLLRKAFLSWFRQFQCIETLNFDLVSYEAAQPTDFCWICRNGACFLKVKSQEYFMEQKRWNELKRRKIIHGCTCNLTIRSAVTLRVHNRWTEAPKMHGVNKTYFSGKLSPLAPPRCRPANKVYLFHECKAKKFLVGHKTLFRE